MGDEHVSALKLFFALEGLLQSKSQVAERFHWLLLEYSQDDFQQAVLLKTLNNTHQTLLHLACHNGDAFIVERLLDCDPTNFQLWERNRWRRLPIHEVCCNTCPHPAPPKLLKRMIERQPKIIYEKGTFGRLPLHFACSSVASKELVPLLLESDPTTVWAKDQHGNLPLHVACMAEAPFLVIQMLLEKDFPDYKSLRIPNNHGLLPLDLACRARSNSETIHYLLLCSLQQRIEQRLGLEIWKQDVNDCIDSLLRPLLSDTSPKFNQKRILKVYQKLLQYEQKERGSLLELAIWKNSCLYWDDRYQFRSMQEIENKNNNNLDPVEYKKRHHTLGGIDVIVQQVLGFLPPHYQIEDPVPAFVLRALRTKESYSNHAKK